MIKSILFILLFSFVVSDTFGQQVSLDKEEIAINKLPEDTAKVNRLNDYAGKIQFANPLKAIAIIQSSIVMASKINYPFGLSVAYGLRAGLLFYEMKLDSCKLLVDKAYELVKNKKDNASKNQTANLINRYAAMYQRKQNYDSAVEWYLQAANIFIETGEDSKIIYSYYNLSGIYKYLSDTTKMFFYARETSRLAAHANDTLLLVRGLIALADSYDFTKQYDSALIISKKGLLLAQKQDMTFAVGIFNNFIGLYYTNKAMLYDSAIIYYNIALQSFNKINTQYDIALVLQNMGNAYLKKKDYVNAVKFSKQAAALSQSLKFDQVLNSSLMSLVLAEESMGNITEGFKHLKQYVQVNDSIQSRNNQKKVYVLETKYQNKKKEIVLLAQQKIIERKSLLNYLLAFGVISLAIIFTLLYLNYRYKQNLQQKRITELETEKQLTATAAVLKGEEQERTRLAKDLHDGLGGMLSGIKFSMNTMKGNLLMTPDNAQAFERSIDMLDSSIKEMRRVAHNMMPEALVKFGLDTALKDFCNDINQSGALKVNYQSIGVEQATIEKTTAITIYRVVQELINNTMKHAAAKNAIVQVSKTDELLSITVEDDGKGFDPVILQHAKGIGWTNIKSRVDFLKGILDVQSSIGNGTSIHIELQA
jgi:two-component system, NarL family, sensor kinase